jgi:hypothetical protein
VSRFYRDLYKLVKIPRRGSKGFLSTLQALSKVPRHGTSLLQWKTNLDKHKTPILPSLPKVPRLSAVTRGPGRNRKTPSRELKSPNILLIEKRVPQLEIYKVSHAGIRSELGRQCAVWYAISTGNLLAISDRILQAQVPRLSSSHKQVTL